MKVDKQEVLHHEGGDEAETAKPEKKSRKDHYMEKNPDFGVLECGMNKETGINFNRSCTDILCVFFFLAFVGCMFGTAIYGLIKGHPKVMIAPYDHSGNYCGINKTYEEYGHLYFTNLSPTWTDASGRTHVPKPWEIGKRVFYEESVCVKECPKNKGQKPECHPGHDYDVKCNRVNDETPGTSSMMGVCWPHFDDMAKVEKENWAMVTEELKKNGFFKQFVNLQTAWKAILLSMATAFLLCLIYIYFMSIFAEYVAWGLIALTQIGFIVLTIGSFYFFATTDGDNKYGALVGGIIGAILSLLFCIMLWCGWSQLKLAIEIVNCSADFLAQTKRMLAVPLLYYVFLFFFFSFWLSCVISVMSMGKISPDTNDTVTYYPLKKDITWGDRKDVGKMVNWMLAFLCFGLVWFVFFLQASNNYVVMVTAATYYFTSNREKYGSGQVSTGLRWAWVHNFGSIAFGSFIIAVIFTIRVIVYYICKKAESASGDNAFVKCISCLVQCFLKCLEEIIEYINRAAYAFMSIAGQGFCKSAYNGLLLNFKHGAKFAFGNYLAFVFILLGKIGITVFNTFLAWMFMKHVSKSAAEVSNPYGPLIIVALTSYFIVSVFLGLFDESVLAMMTSVTADLDINGKADWGPATLHEVLDDMEEKEHK